MKSKINCVLCSIGCLIAIDSIAQEEKSISVPDSFGLMNAGIISNPNNEILQMQSLTNFLQNNNLIQVTQIGAYNYSDITFQSQNTTVMVNQNGYNNFLDLYKNTDEINQFVMQSGTNNFISDFSINAVNETNMSIIQDGNNLSLYNNGSNSISKDLKITQTGNSGTIYIFNH
jgi:hypothetical protein